jgi:formylglycine-generating enzyme required for sulfatase activity
MDSGMKQDKASICEKAKIEILLQKAQDSLLNPIERAEAADTLDSLGYAPEDLYSFVKIPGDEKCAIFWIGKHPVTNRQYARFLHPEHFDDQALWIDFPEIASQDEGCRPLESTGEAGWKWLQRVLRDDDYLFKEGILFPRYWQDSRFGFQRPSAPVVGVTWWEANAYARWLLLHWDDLEEGWQGTRLGLAKPALIRLPRENEWIRAACGPDALSPGAGGEADGRYAFGRLKNPRMEVGRFCNMDESGIGRTTPVWTYPQGESPYGVRDMSGNVWEWQGNYFDQDHDAWSLRGGSWYDSCHFGRVSSRLNELFLNGYSGSSWGSCIGFRLAALPVSQG